MSNQFNILFASDRSYSAHLATALFSLLEHNPKWQFYIHVATTDLTDQDVDILNDITSSFGVKLKVHYLSNTMFYGLVLNHHFTNANYYRIFADELIPADSVLYLDADLIVVDSLDDLFGTNLGDSYLAAVENPGFNRHDELGMDRESKYFNSGVMLINLKKWREDGIKDAVINLVRERPEAIHFVDQCGLNGVINGKW